MINITLDHYNPKYVAKLSVENLWNKGLIKSKKKMQYIINAAKFVNEIENHVENGILSFFDKFAYPGSSVFERWALACLISQSIKGIGPVLACDFLKETGYLNFGKPDVHVKRILDRIGILDDLSGNIIASKEDFNFFQLLDLIAREQGITMFEADKILWLFGTGYNDSNKSIGGICVNEQPRCTVCKVCNHCDYAKNKK